MEQYPEARTEKQPVRNLKTNAEETILAMAKIEGPEWMAAQIAAQNGEANTSDRAVSVQ